MYQTLSITSHDIIAFTIQTIALTASEAIQENFINSK